MTVFSRRKLLLCALLLAVSGAGAWDVSRITQTMQQQYGPPGVERLRAWLALIERLRGLRVNEQLKAVNDFWNVQVLASEDRKLWQQNDYWATPLESLGRGAGDCEDFVIGKYFTLLRLGVSSAQMRLIYVRARIGGIGSTPSIAHMVLGFYATPQVEPVVLDNLVSSLDRASQRPDLTPVFSFDAEGIYVNGARSASSDRISRWQDLLARMRKEGFT